MLRRASIGEKCRSFPSLDVNYLHDASKTRYSTTGNSTSEVDINGLAERCGYTLRLIRKGMYFRVEEPLQSSMEQLMGNWKKNSSWFISLNAREAPVKSEGRLRRFSILHWMWEETVAKDKDKVEVLNAFASIFIRKVSCSQGAQPPELEDW